MPRKKRGSLQRKILPDPKYRDLTVSKLINKLMLEGKKSIAERIVFGALDTIAERKKDDPLKLLKQALDNVKPVLEVRSRRVGGANYQVPIEVRPERRLSLGLMWLIQGARERPSKSMADGLATEVLEASENRGGAIKKKEDMHRMAEANKAFAHFRW